MKRSNLQKLIVGGMQPMPPDEGFTETVYISSIVEPELWKDSVRSAIDYYTGEVIYG